jgi:hypothetical protein
MAHLIERLLNPSILGTLLPIILFVTTDIYEKVKIRRLLKCIRTMRKRHDPDLWRVYADNKHFFSSNVRKM